MAEDTVTELEQNAPTQNLDALTRILNQSIETACKVIHQSVDRKLEVAISSINQKVDELAANQLPHQRGAGTSSPQSWADRMDRRDRGDVSPPLDDGTVHWPDSDEEEPPRKSRKISVSEETKELIKSAFCKSLPNATRKETRNRCPVPDVPYTRCPRVDPMFKTPDSRFSSNTDAKQIDNDLQKVQAFTLDVAAPLLELAEAAGSGPDVMLSREPKEMVHDALRLLGNAVAQTSKVRRKRILKVCNQDIQDLADEEDLFLESSPNLFGKEFEKQMKERAESVKLLNKSQQRSSSQSGGKQFFRGSRPLQTQRGGGLSYRGGRARFNPMGQNRNTLTGSQSSRPRGNFQKK